MTRIKDMSEMQRRSWITFIADMIVFIWFLRTATSGFGLNLSINDYSPGRLLGLYAGTIVMIVILHVIVSIVFSIRAGKDQLDLKDERDILIERQGASCGYGFIVVAINLFIIQYLIEHATEDYGLDLGIEIPSHLIFFILCIGFIADLIKNAVMILAYRGD